ncbi:MAG: hypothetical protein HON90_13330 [Halobacteriovoraceae bacterium]|nr:hypothetical protein [Halobacteriovoraceae bacterium]
MISKLNVLVSCHCNNNGLYVKNITNAVDRNPVHEEPGEVESEKLFKLGFVLLISLWQQGAA